jgi:hypothetical protein
MSTLIYARKSCSMLLDFETHANELTIAHECAHEDTNHDYHAVF